VRKLLGGIADAFADRNFRIYSIGSILSWITYFIQAIAFSWTAWEASHSTAWLALVSLLTVAATVVFIPVGGVLADRHDRFRMVMTAYAFDALKTFVLAILAFTGHLGLPAICISAFLHGLIHSFSIPASYGMMPRFVSRDRLAAAIGVNSAYTQFAIFAGPAIAGWILVHWGVAAAFATNVLGYAIYFITASRLRTPPEYRQSKAQPKSIRQDIFEGARYIFAHRGLSALILLVLVGDAISMAVYQMMPAFSDLILKRGVAGVSILYGAAGLGATFAALWLAQGGAGRATPHRVLWAFLGVATSICLLAASVGLAIAVIAMLLFGFSGETRRTATVSIMQSSIDDAQRGRVMSTQFLFTQIAGGLGMAAVGIVAQGAGLRIPMVAAALTLIAVWLVVMRRRQKITDAFSTAGRPAA
jgi:MFS family permease